MFPRLEIDPPITRSDVVFTAILVLIVLAIGVVLTIPQMPYDLASYRPNLPPVEALQGLAGILPASSGIVPHIDSIVSHAENHKAGETTWAGAINTP